MKIPSHIKGFIALLLLTFIIAGLSTYFKHYVGLKENLRYFGLYCFTGFPVAFLVLLFGYVYYPRKEEPYIRKEPTQPPTYGKFFMNKPKKDKSNPG